MSKEAKNSLFVKDDKKVRVSPEDSNQKTSSRDNWQILIVDDDPEIHDVTKLALRKFKFKGKGLTFLSAYSGQEASHLIEAHPETAVILLDVVMEKDDAGLTLVKHIRDVLQNRWVRIILRTGHPGQAPEKDVVLEHDINDYKLKTELTAQRLFATLVTALRSYHDLISVEASRKEIAVAINSRQTEAEREQTAEELGRYTAELEEMASFLDSIIENMPSGIFVKDAEDLKFVQWNKASEELFGLKKEEVIGKNDYAFFSKEEADYFISTDREVLAGGKPVDIPEETVHTPHKGRRLLHTRKTPIFGTDGKLKYLLGFSQDITERKQAEEELFKRVIELETVARMSTAASSILETDKFLQEVVDLTKISLNLYHAHIYLLDETSQTFELTAGAGKVGRQMVAKGWSIPVEHEHSLVARAARIRQGVIANNVREEPDFLPNPLLPHTRSEMTVPLIAGDKVLGVLDVQADVANRFTEEDVRIKTTLAAQVAVALQNTRLFTEQQQTAFLVEQRVKELNCLNDIGRKMEDTPPVPEFLQWVTERTPPAMQYPDLCLMAIEFNGQAYGLVEAMELPNQIAQGLYVSSELAGWVYIAYIEKQDFLSEERALLRGIATRLSGYIENRRLFEQTEAALSETRVLYEVSRALTTIVDMNRVLASMLAALNQNYIAVGALMINLVTIDVDQAGQPEWGEFIAEWRPDGTEPAVAVGSRYSLKDTSFTKLWATDVLTPLFISDVQIDERLDKTTRRVYARNRLRASVTMPLSVAGRWVGLLTIGWAKPQEFSEQDAQLYRALMRQVAPAVDNRRLSEQTRAALAQTEALYTGSDRVVRAATLDDVLQALVHSTALQHFDRANFIFFDRPWENEPPELMTVTAVWEKSGKESIAPVGNTYILEQFPFTQLFTRDASVIISNIAGDERIDDNTRTLFLERLGMQSLMIFPLVAGGQWIGITTGQSAEVQKVSEEESRQIASLIDQAAAVIQTQRLVEQTQEALAETRTLYEARRSIAEASTTEQVLQVLIDNIAATDVDRCWVLFNDVITEPMEWIELAAAWERAGIEQDEATPIGARFPVEQFLLIRLFSRDESFVVNNALEDERLAVVEREMVIEQMQAQSLALIPLATVEHWLGMLVITCRNPHTFTERELRLYRSVSDRAAITIDNRRLFEQTEAALAEMGDLYRASQSINVATTLDEVLYALMEGADLPAMNRASIILFNRPWIGDDMPEYVNRLAAWDERIEEPLLKVGDSYELSAFPTVQLMRPDTPLALSDVETDPRLDEVTSSLFRNTFLARSTVFVPLVPGGQWIGFFNPMMSQVFEFDEAHLRRLTTLTGQSAVVVQSLLRLQETEGALAQTEMLYHAGRRINESEDLQEMVAAVVEAVPVPAVNRAVLFIYEQNEAGEMEAALVEANWHSGQGTLPTPVDTRYPWAVFTTLNILLSPEAIFFDDAQHDERIDPATLKVLQRQNIYSMAVLPLLVGPRQLGALLLETEEIYHFTEAETALYLALARQLAVAVDGQRLFKQTERQAKRERLINTISQKIQGTTTVESALQTAIQELGQVFQARYTQVELTADGETSKNKTRIDGA